MGNCKICGDELREILWECGMRGYFLLRATFLRLASGAGDAAVAGDRSPDNPFNAAFRAYTRACRRAIRHPRRHRLRTNQVVKLVGQALCETAGLRAKPRGGEKVSSPEDQPCT